MGALNINRSRSVNCRHWSRVIKQFSGHVLVRFSRGFFVDLPHDTPRRIRCFARNLRNMSLMGAVLQTTVKSGVSALPSSSSALMQLPLAQQERFRKLHRLAASGQELLGQIPQYYNPKVCRFYWNAHAHIKAAMAQTIPTL
jgi:hypothetical protein